MLNINNTKFIILSCEKYLDTRINAIRRTWGQNINKIFLMDQSSHSDSELIGYDTPQTYDDIQEKYIKFFINYNFEEFDYYFFTDDDTFVVLKNLQKEVLPKPDVKFCLGRHLILTERGMDKWGNDTHYPFHKISGKNTYLPLNYLSGGSGFILPKITCISIQEHLKNTAFEDISRSGFSDVSIGFWMRTCDIKLIESDNFWWSTPEKLINNNWENFKNDRTELTFHYVSVERMFELHTQYNND